MFYAIFFVEEKWKIKYVTLGLKQDGSRFDHQYAFFLSTAGSLDSLRL